jgi:hypothetical protein
VNVLAIGERPLTKLSMIADLDIHMVAERMTARDTCVVRCRQPAELPARLAALAARGPIARLDIFDHGAEGMQMLGGDALFASDAHPGSALIGLELARRIAPQLADTAQVRLLGCSTAEGRAGRLLLLKLARALGGHRIVFGTIDRVVEADFDAGGYARVMEHQRLFSSAAALDIEAPAAMRRFENMRAVREALA